MKNDITKKLMGRFFGKGGIHCDCCNWTHCRNGRHHKKTLLRKKIRAELKKLQKRETEQDNG